MAGGCMAPRVPRRSEGCRNDEGLSEWHAKRYGPPSEFGYEKLIPLFKAEKWDPDALVKFFKECGARFIMPVATHHDNFDMYDSSFPWNSVKMGPHRDTLREWKDAARKQGLKFGVSTHLYWSPRFFNTARQYPKAGHTGVETVQHGLRSEELCLARIAGTSTGMTAVGN